MSTNLSENDMTDSGTVKESEMEREFYGNRRILNKVENDDMIRKTVCTYYKC